MIKLQRILLPTDFSDFSSVATDYACALVDQFGAQLHLLHVLEVHTGSTPQFVFGLVVPSKVEESRQAAEEALSTLLDSEWAAGKRVVTATAQGPPFLGIIRYAKEHDIDMIIMGTHGRSGINHAMIGSVAERVVRKSPCPVLTVRPEGHQFVMP